LTQALEDLDKGNEKVEDIAVSVGSMSSALANIAANGTNEDHSGYDSRVEGYGERVSGRALQLDTSRVRKSDGAGGKKSPELFQKLKLKIEAKLAELCGMGACDACMGDCEFVTHGAVE